MGLEPRQPLAGRRADPWSYPADAEPRAFCDQPAALRTYDRATRPPGLAQVPCLAQLPSGVNNLPAFGHVKEMQEIYVPVTDARRTSEIAM